jgi:hypothetical protein
MPVSSSRASAATCAAGVPADGIEEYAGDDLRGGYRWPVGSGLTAVVIFSPALPKRLRQRTSPSPKTGDA